ncbi:hypothetical protein [Luteimonas terricola]|uniref:Uncharacterized protein n=1 Tax=Luteimonas terricola TaxID=645597 RepID=A0ABQ2EHY6_9GAMM|nr:hypothetical protein [Luteimonas terricola]GGK13052.1 hypothetical protein GCM10011394_22860 [Luteimonas terricola]
MINRSFRHVHARFDASQFGAMFAPRKPRHPLMRLAVGLLGLALLAVLLVLGVVVGTAMLAVGLARRLLGRRAKPQAHTGNVVDAEYRVVDKPAHTLPY